MDPSSIVSAQDDGASGQEFDFRVEYVSPAKLPPQPYFRDWMTSDSGGTGVTLYLDVLGTGDYPMHNMYPVDPTYNRRSSDLLAEGAADRQHGSMLSGDLNAYSDGLYYPAISDWAYSSLPVGVYHFFFGCSADYLKFADGSYFLEHQGFPKQWGDGGEDNL